MSQNPDETSEPQDRGSQGQDKEFDSGLDYGAFASEEPDFPEDRMDKEPTPRTSAEEAPSADQEVPAGTASSPHAAGSGSADPGTADPGPAGRR